MWCIALFDFLWYLKYIRGNKIEMLFWTKRWKILFVSRVDRTRIWNIRGRSAYPFFIFYRTPIASEIRYKTPVSFKLTLSLIEHSRNGIEKYEPLLPRSSILEEPLSLFFRVCEKNVISHTPPPKVYHETPGNWVFSLSNHGRSQSWAFGEEKGGSPTHSRLLPLLFSSLSLSR